MNVDEVLVIARRWHGDQKDKLGEDYVSGHLRRVAMTLYEGDGKPDLITAGALHDSLEDTACTPDDLRREGVTDESIRIIETVTRHGDETYDDFVTRVIEGGQSSIELKLADIGDNLDDQRLSRLPAETADRLKRKYGLARSRLLSELT
jgi:(p)ppGpp synthase/HD superfamily hydrolase